MVERVWESLLLNLRRLWNMFIELIAPSIKVSRGDFNVSGLKVSKNDTYSSNFLSNKMKWKVASQTGKFAMRGVN